MSNKMMMIAAAAFAAVSMNSVSAQAPAAPAAPAGAQPMPMPMRQPAVTLDSVLGFLPDVVAEGKGVKLTKKQVIEAVGDMLKQNGIPPEMGGAILAQQPKEAYKEMIQGMVDTEMMKAMTEKAGIKASPELVKESFDKMLKSLPPERAEMFNSMLKQRGMTVDQYKNEIAKNPSTQQAIAFQKWIETTFENKPEFAVSDADAEKFYRENQKSFEVPEMVSASHILISVPSTDDAGKPLSAEAMKKADADALKKAQDILAELKQGKNFGELAEKNSDCPSGKNSKGALGKFTRGKMVKEFDDSAFAMKTKGEMSDVVKTKFGYHIIKLDEDRVAAGFRGFPEVKGEIVSFLKNQKIQKAVEEQLNKEKAAANIKIFGFDAAPEAKTAPAPAEKPAVEKK